MESQKKPGVAFWTTVILVVVSYPATFGPACWISSRTGIGASVVSAAYAPLTWNLGNAFDRQPTPIIGEALSRYGDLGAAPHWMWLTSWNPLIGMTWEWTDTSKSRRGHSHGVKPPAAPPDQPADSN